MKNPYKNKDWLIKKYINEKKSVVKIALEIGVNGVTIFNWLQRFNIPLRPNVPPHAKDTYRNKKWLEQRYTTEDKSIVEIAKEAGVHTTTIEAHLRKSKIKRKGGPAGKHEGQIYNNKEWLHQQYNVKKRPIQEIADETNTCFVTIWKHILKFGIKKPTPIYDDEEWLKEEYIYKRKFAREIAEEVGVDRTTITAHLKKYGIIKYIYSETIPTFSKLLRQKVHNKWRSLVLKRDEFICGCCGANENLVAHHIISFKDIINQILQENSELNIYTEYGQNKMLNIASNDYRINDVDNGITLCKSCHLKMHRGEIR